MYLLKINNLVGGIFDSYQNAVSAAESIISIYIREGIRGNLNHSLNTARYTLNQYIIDIQKFEVNRAIA